MTLITRGWMIVDLNGNMVTTTLSTVSQARSWALLAFSQQFSLHKATEAGYRAIRVEIKELKE